MTKKTKPTTARRTPYLGIQSFLVRDGTVDEKHCRAPLAPDVRSVYCGMSAKHLRKIVRVASEPDIPTHVTMGERSIVHKDNIEEYAKIEGHCAVACLRELGMREELQRLVLSVVVDMSSFRPWRDTVKVVANLSRQYEKDTIGILAVIRVFEKRQHDAPHEEPVTALQMALAKGLKYATEEAPFASLCGLTATGSMSRRRQSIASVDPYNVLPWDRPAICGEPTETEMTEAREWVSARVATSTPAHAAAKRDEEPASVETWLTEIAKLPSRKAAYLAATLAAEGLCTVGDLRTVAGQSTVTSFGTLKAELENLCTELKERTDQALNAKDYMALYNGLTPKELSTACH